MTLDSRTSPVNDDADAETALTRIWAQLLDLDAGQIARTASFLSLGGDSVLAVRMAALVRRELGVVLALPDVRVETTIDELAGLVRRRGDAETDNRSLDLRVTRRSDPRQEFPLLPLQQGYFVGQQHGWELSYDSAHYYLDWGLRGVDDEDAVEALTDAVERLATHQPTLRARVTPEGRQYVLPVDAPGAIPGVQVHDLRDATPEAVTRRLAGIRHEMSTSGPDPTRGPGIDIRLSMLPGGLGRLHLGLSLLTYDGWSSSVLSRDLLLMAADWNATPAPLEIDFGDYVTSLQRLPQTDAWQADREWWWSRLDDVPAPPALPLVADPHDVRPQVMGNREHRWGPDSWDALREQCKNHGVTPSTAMMTAFAVVLARWAGHHRLLLNSLQLNRLPIHPDTHRVVGAFASTMLLPLTLQPGRSFAELATTNQAAAGEHAAHNLITGVEVGRELARRRGSWRPIGPVVFQSVLGVDAAMGGGPPQDAGPLGTVLAKDYFHQLRTPQVAIEVRCFELMDELVAVFSLVDELFDAGDVTAAFTEFIALVDGLADGTAWSREPELPAPADPAADGPGLRLSRLPAVAAEQASGPPADDLELAVADVFEDLLEVPVVDRGADFFRLGGDSLLAVRAVSRLAREAGVTVPIRDFLAAPTVAGVAGAARAQQGGDQ